jgi:hypothetical protein
MAVQDLFRFRATSSRLRFCRDLVAQVGFK